MALKKELSLLYNILSTKIKSLPLNIRPRASRDLEDIFYNYNIIEDQVKLEAIKKRAENKLVILDMSVESGPKSVSVPGVKNFIVKDGKVEEGKSEVKFQPDYSNWYGGNVDPQDLRRHKDLLDRQHYSGPFWEGRKRNPSIIDEENPRYDNVAPEPHPDESLRAEKESSFEAVKR
jgi:hypothetical protein